MGARMNDALEAVHDSMDEEKPALPDLVDDRIALLLRSQQYTAEELFVVDVRSGAERAARDLAVAKLRGTLADALHHPTPANYEAAGRAAAWLCHLAMGAAARDHIELYGAEP